MGAGWPLDTTSWEGKDNAYLQGIAWGEMKKLWKKGFLAYIIVPWNLADIFTLANFMGWIGTYIYAPVSVASNF